MKVANCFASCHLTEQLEKERVFWICHLELEIMKFKGSSRGGGRENNSTSSASMAAV